MSIEELPSHITSFYSIYFISNKLDKRKGKSYVQWVQYVYMHFDNLTVMLSV